jgi:hypothetical protein
MVTAILIVIDHDPTNVLARSFMFEFSWHFGYAACALYLLGIAQTLSEVKPRKRGGKEKNDFQPPPCFVSSSGTLTFLYS